MMNIHATHIGVCASMCDHGGTPHMTRETLIPISLPTLALCAACAGKDGARGPAGAPGAKGQDGSDGDDGQDGVDRVLDPSLPPLEKMFAALGGRDAVLALSHLSHD